MLLLAVPDTDDLGQMGPDKVGQFTSLLMSIATCLEMSKSKVPPFAESMSACILLDSLMTICVSFRWDPSNGRDVHPAVMTKAGRPILSHSLRRTCFMNVSKQSSCQAACGLIVQPCILNQGTFVQNMLHSSLADFAGRHPQSGPIRKQALNM